MGKRQRKVVLLLLAALLSVGSIHGQSRAELMERSRSQSNEAQVIDLEEGEGESEETENLSDETEDEKPELNAALLKEGDSPENNNYYRSDVAVRAVISGGDASEADVLWTIVYTEAGSNVIYEGTYSQAELGSHMDEFGLFSVDSEEDSEMADRRENLVFAKEGNYKVGLSVTDLEGNVLILEPVEFTIDKTAPNAWIVYQSKGGHPVIQAGDVLTSPIYFNEDDGDVSAFLVVSEQNMGEMNAELNLSIQTAVEGQQEIADRTAMEIEEEIREISAWQKGDRDTMSYRIPIEADGSYQIDFDYTDLAGNSLEKHVAGYVVRDTKEPVVHFRFDTSDCINGNYYQSDQVLKIIVQEQNFDMTCKPEILTEEEGGCSFSGWEMQDETAEGEIIFSGDGDYKVTFECLDLAGNQSKKVESDMFTIDKTAPVIQVDYESGPVNDSIYYNDSRTAMITIYEHNFFEQGAKIFAASEDGDVVPVISQWSSDGDSHTATVHFESDGIYTMKVSCTDCAGNTAVDYQSERFIIDRTSPMLLISGVKDRSANNGVVAPFVLLYDRNDNGKGISLSLKDASGTEIDLSDMVHSSLNAHGQTVKFDDFAAGMDGIYTLTAAASDRAGNESVQQIHFSVNRGGSEYSLGQSTQMMIEKGFISRPENLVIYEKNVDNLEYIEVSYSHEGEVVILEEGQDYTVKQTVDENKMKEYMYTIPSECFYEEGRYSVYLYSEDYASNIMTNQARGKEINFVVDHTAPRIIISNLEDRGNYNEKEHEFTVNVSDNTVLDRVMYYLDDQLVRTFQADELAGQLAGEDAAICLTLKEKPDYQRVKFISRDVAGNESNPVEMDVMVNSSRQITQKEAKTSLLLWIMIGFLIAAVCGIVIFCIVREKNSSE